ncbi:hypothetical protein CAOG_00982 [Capsaspora owczarzaki ATCC 30864]|uniref:Uncharacterized protein n=1 Tax=Capsaspora owczarzaki (strain ATCC 30864) TaxID=595528 RepID=A0A0D2WJI7_CAPO3|nr:hypothetical protein CAOG_00982 [Capsaspora owczarzaki ATCC 30864]KJE89533.1 hypothetical protein CAOG_000982 [Capsaspora owczarzaki ATCC 30864]|eukprot:XP_004365853.2 hypothetical protein CAOG_00982 [Capsaspora owczarzaki ATCC 30864]
MRSARPGNAAGGGASGSSSNIHGGSTLGGGGAEGRMLKNAHHRQLSSSDAEAGGLRRAGSSGLLMYISNSASRSAGMAGGLSTPEGRMLSAARLAAVLLLSLGAVYLVARSVYDPVEYSRYWKPDVDAWQRADNERHEASRRFVDWRLKVAQNASADFGGTQQQQQQHQRRLLSQGAAVDGETEPAGMAQQLSDGAQDQLQGADKVQDGTRHILMMTGTRAGRMKNAETSGDASKGADAPAAAAVPALTRRTADTKGSPDPLSARANAVGGASSVRRRIHGGADLSPFKLPPVTLKEREMMHHQRSWFPELVTPESGKESVLCIGLTSSGMENSPYLEDSVASILMHLSPDDAEKVSLVLLAEQDQYDEVAERLSPLLPVLQGPDASYALDAQSKPSAAAASRAAMETLNYAYMLDFCAATSNYVLIVKNNAVAAPYFVPKSLAAIDRLEQSMPENWLTLKLFYTDYYGGFTLEDRILLAVLGIAGGLIVSYMLVMVHSRTARAFYLWPLGFVTGVLLVVALPLIAGKQNVIAAQFGVNQVSGVSIPEAQIYPANHAAVLSRYLRQHAHSKPLQSILQSYVQSRSATEYRLVPDLFQQVGVYASAPESPSAVEPQAADLVKTSRTFWRSYDVLATLTEILPNHGAIRDHSALASYIFSRIRLEQSGRL